jgi:hypothetical protein
MNLLYEAVFKAHTKRGEVVNQCASLGVRDACPLDFAKMSNIDSGGEVAKAAKELFEMFFRADAEFSDLGDEGAIR